MNGEIASEEPRTQRSARHQRETLHSAFVALAGAIRASIDAQRASIVVQEKIADVIERLAEEEPSSGWLTIAEAARLMNVSSSTVRSLIAKSSLRAVNITPSATRVPREAVEEFRRRRERRVPRS